MSKYIIPALAITLVILASGYLYRIYAPLIQRNYAGHSPEIIPSPSVLSEADVRGDVPRHLKFLYDTDNNARSLLDKTIATADQNLKSIPKPIARISIAGVAGSDARFKQSAESLRDAKVMQAFSVGYILRATQSYLDAYNRYILAWAKIYKPSGHPINETHLQEMFESYRVMRPQLPSETVALVDTWLIQIANVQKTTKLDPALEINNWKSHRIALIGVIGYITENTELVNYAIDEYKKHIEYMLLPDGRTKDFIERDSIGYHCYTLEPLMNLSRISDLNGYDLIGLTTSKGASLNKSMAFLKPYALGQKTHSEFTRSTSAYDKGTPSKIGKQFDRKRAIETYELYYYFDKDSISVIQNIKANNARFSSLNQLMNHVLSPL